MVLAEATRVVGEVLSDGQVVRRVLAGERPLFEVLMRRYNQRAYRVVRAILRNEAEAEDAMQQAWLQAWRRLPQLEDPDAVAGWLAQIAANEALLRVRRREPLDPLPEADGLEAFDAVNPERQAAAREQARAVEAAVDLLPDGQREAFMLRTVEGLDTGEAAALLRVSPGALKVRLHRAHLALRAELGDAVDAAPAAFRFAAPRCDPMVAWVMARIGQEP